MSIRFINSGSAAILLAGLCAPTASAAFKDKPMFKEQFVKVNGVRLHVVSAGKGPLILFLHGFPEFWYEWKNQLAEFGKDHHAVAPDLRGYNLSDKPADVAAYQVPNLVEDVRQLAATLLNAERRRTDAQRSSRFVLVAHDWGG